MDTIDKGPRKDRAVSVPDAESKKVPSDHFALVSSAVRDALPTLSASLREALESNIDSFIRQVLNDMHAYELAMYEKVDPTSYAKKRLDAWVDEQEKNRAYARYRRSLKIFSHPYSVSGSAGYTELSLQHGLFGSN